jgi:hypothetical protein
MKLFLVKPFYIVLYVPQQMPKMAEAGRERGRQVLFSLNEKKEGNKLYVHLLIPLLVSKYALTELGIQ